MELGTAPAIQEAIRRRSDHPTFGYTIQPDLIWTRVARWLRERHSWPGLKETDFVFTSNMISSTVNGIRAFTKPGDAVCMLLPLYHPLQDLVRKEGRKLVTVYLSLSKTDSGVQYEIDFEALRKCFKEEHVKALIWCSPHNPGGRVWSRTELEKVVSLSQKHNVVIISDEIHSDLVLPSCNIRHIPIAVVARSLGYHDHVMTMGGPGKAWNLAGIHCGYVVLESEKMRTRYLEIAGHAHLTFGSVFATTAMLATYEAIGDVDDSQRPQATSDRLLGASEWLGLTLKYIESNIDLLEWYILKNLPRIRVMRPQASYLVWLDCRRMGLSGVPSIENGVEVHSELETFFIHSARVHLSNGFQFGGIHTSSYMRINVACPKSYLMKALQRIARAYCDKYESVGI